MPRKQGLTGNPREALWWVNLWVNGKANFDLAQFDSLPISELTAHECDQLARLAAQAAEN